MTIIGKQPTYWTNNGKHQELLCYTYDDVPLLGVAQTAEVELLRTVNNIYYDLYNNGLANVESKLPPLRDAMRSLHTQLIANGLTREQYDMIWFCWEPLETEPGKDRDIDEPDGYFPEWDDSSGWFTERLELAFESMADTSILIAARAKGLV